MDFVDKFSTIHLDVLREIGNIGAGNAATALSQLLNKKIEMHVPNVRISSFNEMLDLVGGAENVVASVFLRIEGDAPGCMFFILSLDQASLFIRQMIGSSDSSLFTPPYDEMALSALQELGNILCGAYLTSLSDFTNLNLHPSVPAISIDMFGAIISYGFIELSQVSDHAILIETTLNEDDGKKEDGIKGHFFLLPDPDSFHTIFKALGVNHDVE